MRIYYIAAIAGLCLAAIFLIPQDATGSKNEGERSLSIANKGQTIAPLPLPIPEPKPTDPVRYEIEKYDWDADVIERLIECESGGDPTAKNTTQYESSHGLLQINIYAHGQYAVHKLYSPEYNIWAAFNIYEEEGYYAWLNCARKIGVI